MKLYIREYTNKCYEVHLRSALPLNIIL